jgi:tetraacyldisaccharide 4'-kinase
VPEWLFARDETAWRRALLAPLVPLAGLYRAGARLHRAAYDFGLRERVRLPAQVISVGNLAVGGSGKTPVCAWLARELAARGHKAAVLSRGVGGRRLRQTNVVSDGERCLAGPGDVGDEPVWIARRAPGVRVLAGANRAALGMRAVALGADVLILDDGFQHHRVSRDVDLVCIDAASGLGNRYVLPRGPLREPPARLARADALLLTRSVRGQPDPSGLPAGTRRFRLEIGPRALRDAATGESLPLDTLRGLRCGVVCAIARPDRLIAAALGLGAEPVAVRTFRDHHLYRDAEIRSLDRALVWLTTEKDAVKIPASWLEPRRLLVLEEEVGGGDAGALLEWLGLRLDAAARRA